MRVLLIEDDQLFADSLLTFLRPKYMVDHVRFCRAGEFQATTNEYDLIVLDHQLPDGLGSDLCKKLRQLEIATPVLLLTGYPHLAPVVKSLDLGADEYLTKPVRFDELQARMSALLRRFPQRHSSPVLQCSDLVVDTVHETVTRAGQPIELGRRAYQILEFLLRRKGQTVRRETLLEHIWGNTKTSLNLVDAQIKLIRQAIDKPFGQPLLQTVHGLGFRLQDPAQSTPRPATKPKHAHH